MCLNWKASLQLGKVLCWPRQSCGLWTDLSGCQLKLFFCKTCKTTRLKMGQADKCVCCSRLKCSWARLESDPGYSKRLDEMSVSILIQWVDKREQKPLTYFRNFSLQKYGEAADTTIKSATVDTDCRMAMLEVDQPRGSTFSVKVDWATGSTNLWAYRSYQILPVKKAS